MNKHEDAFNHKRQTQKEEKQKANMYNGNHVEFKAYCSVTVVRYFQKVFAEPTAFPNLSAHPGHTRQIDPTAFLSLVQPGSCAAGPLRPQACENNKLPST